jgi:hypothetical protein
MIFYPNRKAATKGGSVSGFSKTDDAAPNLR